MPDHPRSRGVYAPPPGWSRAGAGSSPLARGLRRHGQPILSATGIIPARAGFTPPGNYRCRRRPDHPRSRGVYGWPRVRDRCKRGSSPLARGLPQPNHQRIRGRRIIPARAGFTRHGSIGVCGPWDHPRSRGVYQDQSGVCSPRSGIIPARAGFTDGIGIIPAARGDHPRSRGVYPRGCSWGPHASGSSPLARGLLPRAHLPHPRPGIIPARAGFTILAVVPEDGNTDHPRSRGVYGMRVSLIHENAGSSPLARGLHDPRRRPGRLPRIIPARAGFTRFGSHPPGGHRDHPRSRGVYRPDGASSAVSAGSSPLARGLLDFFPAISVPLRIIPARAGFT